MAGYYYKAHACIMVFDVTRKVTYTNLANWCVTQRRSLSFVPISPYAAHLLP
jgi:Rab-like protein 2